MKPAFLAAGRRKAEEFLFSPMDAKPLALFRIALGLMMLVEAALIYPSLNDLYGPRGFLDATLMRAVSGKNLPAYAGIVEQWGIPYLSLLLGIFWVRTVAIVAFTLGIFTKPANITLWLAQAFFMASGPLSSYGLDRYFHVFLFILVFFPSGKALSIDAWRKAGQLSSGWRERFGLRLCQIALLLTYLNAGLAKSVGFEWWSGDAIWRVLHLPEFTQAEFWWMADYPIVPKVLGIGTVALETFYILGVWLPYAGAAWVLAIIGMHLGISALMNLMNFGLGMALFNGVLFLYPKAREFLRRPGPRRNTNFLLGTFFPRATAARAHALFRRTRRYPRPAWETSLREKGEAFALKNGVQGLRFGPPNPTVLLAHGWGGRGTQMGYFVQPLLDAGFRVVTFDGPGHGESPGNETDLGEYAETILALGEKEGPFAGVIAHSFGAVASVVAASRGLPVKNFVLLGAPSRLDAAFVAFGEALGLPPKAYRLFKEQAERKAGLSIHGTNVGALGAGLKGARALVIHDPEDEVVPFREAEETARAWPQVTLIKAPGLGHRRILKDSFSVEAAVDYLKTNRQN
ncbi:MAG: alpha/beta fold hydrolase [Proteobacteria bacterium]|nr:MAG: alpha/beta fold hydrolase [Pseudomonadota bacterium]